MSNDKMAGQACLMREALEQIANLDDTTPPTVGWALARATEIAREALAQTADVGLTDDLIAVPKEPTEAQWGGLARDIVMWLSFVRPTPAKLFCHLRHLGKKIPNWMSDEAEMHNLDCVPSKGTCAVLVYKAMIYEHEAKKAGEAQS